MTKPYYSDDYVELWHGDCREITAWLEVDALVTDPPYGRDWRQGVLHHDAHQGIAGDKDTTVRDSVLAQWDGLAAVFGDLMLAPPTGTKQVLVYSKPIDAGVRGATAGYRRDVEGVYLVGPWPSGIGGDSSILRTAARMVGGSIGLATRSGHPHAKPLDVLQALIAKTPSGAAIGDPFAGSGSTLLAAKLMGRKAIGVELDEKYCEAAARRLAQETLPYGPIKVKPPVPVFYEPLALDITGEG